MLDQRRRRWADVVQMLLKCFVFSGMIPMILINTMITVTLINIKSSKRKLTIVFLKSLHTLYNTHMYNWKR